MLSQNDWNKLVFENLDDLNSELRKVMGNYQSGIYGDGMASVRIKEEIIKFFK
ncbi:MAG: hypothetical protein IPH57_12840 [Saprospiraceae bacterium]|nr:hypothetical protein [Saprospiraceae bacterium]